MSCPVNLQALPAAVLEEVFTPGNMRGRNSSQLSFPKSRLALWDGSPAGEKLRLQLCSHRKLQVVLLEKALRLAQRNARRSNKPRPLCFFLGSASVSRDEDGVVVTLDRFDPGRDQAGTADRVPSALLPGDVLVPCLFSVRSDVTPEPVVQSEAELHQSFKALQQFMSSRQVLDLSHLLKIRARLLVSQTADAAALSLSWSAVCPAAGVDVQPVRAIPIIPTALLRSLTCVGRPPQHAGRQRGFLTMDQTRKLVLLLESDPKASSLPLVGLWLSGVTHVYNPQVWAWCLRFMFSSALQDRVLSESGCFLLVVFGSTHRTPQFFQCRGSRPGPQPDFQLLSGSQSATLYQVAPVEGRVLTCDLDPEDNSRQAEGFRTAQESFSRTPPDAARVSVSDQDSGVEDEDFSPRPSPSPHAAAPQARRIQPSVPELSLLIDSSLSSNHSSAQDSSPALRPPAAAAPSSSSSAPKPPPHLHSTPNPHLQQPCSCCSCHAHSCTPIFASPMLLAAPAPPPAFHQQTHPSSILQSAPHPSSILQSAPHHLRPSTPPVPPACSHQQTPPLSSRHTPPPPSFSYQQTPPPLDSHVTPPLYHLPPSTSHLSPPVPLISSHQQTPLFSSRRSAPPPSSSSHQQTPPPSTNSPSVPPVPLTSHQKTPPCFSRHTPPSFFSYQQASPPPGSHPNPPPPFLHKNTLPPSTNRPSTPPAPPTSSHQQTPPFPSQHTAPPLSSHQHSPPPSTNSPSTPIPPASSTHQHFPPSPPLSTQSPSTLVSPAPSCPCSHTTPPLPPSCCSDSPSPHPSHPAAADPVSPSWLPRPSCCCDKMRGVASSDTYQLLLHQDRQLRLLQDQVRPPAAPPAGPASRRFLERDIVAEASGVSDLLLESKLDSRAPDECRRRRRQFLVQMLLKAQGRLQSSSRQVDTQTCRSTASIAVETGASLFWGTEPDPSLHQEEEQSPASPPSPSPSSCPSPSASSHDRSVRRLVGGAEEGDDTGRAAPRSSSGPHSGLQSPVLGESASWCGPPDEHLSFYQNLMTLLNSRLQESDRNQEAEGRSRRSSLSVSDHSQSSHSSSCSSSKRTQKKKGSGGDPVIRATLRQLQQLGVSLDEKDLMDDDRIKAVENASTLATINPAAVVSRLTASETIGSALFPGGSVDLSLEANAIALRYLTDSQLSRLSLGGHALHNSPAPSAGDSVLSPSNMSLATRKYMRRYGLIEEEEEEEVLEARRPLTDSQNVKLLPQSQLIRELRPKMQLLAGDKENRSNGRSSLVRGISREPEGSVGNLLDLSRLRQLPKLF